MQVPEFFFEILVFATKHGQNRASSYYTEIGHWIQSTWCYSGCMNTTVMSDYALPVLISCCSRRISTCVPERDSCISSESPVSYRPEKRVHFRCFCQLRLNLQCRNHANIKCSHNMGAVQDSLHPIRSWQQQVVAYSKCTAAITIISVGWG